MQPSNKCRFGLYIGLDSISYAKVERKGPDWSLVSSGSVPWSENSFSPESREDELRAVLQQIVKAENVHQESTQVTLHSRFCVTRIATGEKRQVDEQLAEIVDNGEHYLQLGLGDKLFGHAIVSTDAVRQYGQVAIIKRGLIEAIENAVGGAGLGIEAVDGALNSACRLAGVCQLDADAPLLLVWLGVGGSEIGISHHGRMQLNYHAGTSQTVHQTAEIIRKHLKRLRRFCERYRQVDGGNELNRVLILTAPEQAADLKGELAQLDFEQVFTLQDLGGEAGLRKQLSGRAISSAGVGSALGGVLAHLDPGTFPPTDVFDRYLDTKPTSLLRTALQLYWMPMAAAAALCCVLLGSWWCQHQLRQWDEEIAMMLDSVNEEDQQLSTLHDAEDVLSEYHKLQSHAARGPIGELVHAIATCLPADTRVDWFSLDENDRLILKGNMLGGDRSYEIIKALRQLPQIEEVSLESVGRSSKLGKTGTLFEIHCELAARPTRSTDTEIASIPAVGASR